MNLLTKLGASTLSVVKIIWKHSTKAFQATQFHIRQVNNRPWQLHRRIIQELRWSIPSSRRKVNHYITCEKYIPLEI